MPGKRVSNRLRKRFFPGLACVLALAFFAACSISCDSQADSLFSVPAAEVATASPEPSPQPARTGGLFPPVQNPSATQTDLAPVAPVLLTDLDRKIASIALINQKDRRYYNDTYLYYNAHFRVRGCGPASLTNALSAVFGVTEQEKADQLLLEIMSLMSLFHQPATNQLSIDSLSRLTDPIADRYPLLTELKEAFGGCIESGNDQYTYPLFLERMANKPEGPLLLIGRMRVNDQIRDVVQITDWLYSHDYPDAAVIGFHQSAGTLAGDAPFGSEAGHFVTVYFQAESFSRDGIFYMLDSYAKALTLNEYDGIHYSEAYRLASQINSRFWRIYSFSHMQPCAVRIAMNQPYLSQVSILKESLANGTEDQEALLALREELFADMELYGLGGVMILIP